MSNQLKSDGLSSVARGWRRHFHFDFHVLLVLLQRGWNILAGAITVLFTPLWFTQVEQGYYYAFLSLLAMQVFFELGFNFVVVQLVGHEWAHLKVDSEGNLGGDEVALSRLRSLLSMLRRWYLVVGVMFFGVISAVGFMFFSTKGGLPPGQWLGVWLTMVFFTSINLYLSPLLAVLEGMGRVGQVARLRLVQSVTGYCTLWMALSAHAGLSALPILSIASAVLSLWWMRSHAGLLRAPTGFRPLVSQSIRWRTEIFPLQWRIALSWISGYFIFNSFTLFIFSNQGAAEAGRIGISISVFSSLSTLGMSWINAAAPRMVNCVAKDERHELNVLFLQVLKSSLLFTTCSTLLLLLAFAVLEHLGHPLARRVGTLPVLGCLAAVTIGNTFIFAAATYMRAHKKEPMLAVSIVGGLMTLAAAYYGSAVSSLLTMVLYAVFTLCIGLPWTLALFLPYFRRQKDVQHQN